MNILLVATESVPYCKTGGLADVVYGLARELCVQEHDVRIAIPCYLGIEDLDRMKEIVNSLTISLGTYSRNASIWKAIEKPIFYFVQHDYYFGRDNMYGYLDDYERFIFFTRAVCEMLKESTFQTHERWFPQIIQGYDWATGFIPAWLPQYEKEDERFKSTRFVFSIHNIRSSGIYCNRALRIAGVKNETFDKLKETNDHINFLCRGILFADKSVTVNPDYDDDKNPLPETVQNLSTFFQEKVK